MKEFLDETLAAGEILGIEGSPGTVIWYLNHDWQILKQTLRGIRWQPTFLLPPANWTTPPALGGRPEYWPESHVNFLDRLRALEVDEIHLVNSRSGWCFLYAKRHPGPLHETLPTLWDRLMQERLDA